MKLYYYKTFKPTEDNPALKSYDYGKGVAGYDTKQELPNYIGHFTDKELGEHYNVKGFGARFDNVPRKNW